MANPILVEVTRGPVVESRHRGVIAIIDSGGRTIAALGSVDEPIFPRSAVKPIQALPLVESGAADAFGLGDAELALACASHGGEPRHVEGVAAMLAKVGLDESALECGPQWPASEEARHALIRSGGRPTALHNNCSGKHAGFIATARHRGWDHRGYVAPGHPVQELVRNALSELTDTPLDGAVRGIDGCSIPAYAIRPDRLARAFARMASGEGLPADRAQAAARLVAACQAEPFLLAGRGRFCTEAMTLFGRRLIVKTGGEGVFCAGFPGLGIGVALKCDDGATRAAEAMMAAVIVALLRPDRAELQQVQRRLNPPVLSRRGAQVGELRPAPELAALLDGVAG